MCEITQDHLARAQTLSDKIERAIRTWTNASAQAVGNQQGRRNLIVFAEGQARLFQSYQRDTLALRREIYDIGRNQPCLSG